MRKRDIHPDLVLDVRGLLCPLPVLRLKDAVRRLPPRSLIRVLADDPAIEVDLAAFCYESHHHLLHLDRSNGYYEALIRVGTHRPPEAGDPRADISQP